VSLCDCSTDGSAVWSGNSTATYMGQPSSATYCTLCCHTNLLSVMFSGHTNDSCLPIMKLSMMWWSKFFFAQSNLLKWICLGPHPYPLRWSVQLDGSCVKANSAILCSHYMPSLDYIGTDAGSSFQSWDDGGGN